MAAALEDPMAERARGKAPMDGEAMRDERRTNLGWREGEGEGERRRGRAA